MIRNIPNKYTQEMMLYALNKNFQDTYDFFYLPIDLKVISFDGRTNAILATPLLISYLLSQSRDSSESLMAIGGNIALSV